LRLSDAAVAACSISQSVSGATARDDLLFRLFAAASPVNFQEFKICFDRLEEEL
jgi:hypothetical protein